MKQQNFQQQSRATVTKVRFVSFKCTGNCVLARLHPESWTHSTRSLSHYGLIFSTHTLEYVALPLRTCWTFQMQIVEASDLQCLKCFWLPVAVNFLRHQQKLKSWRNIPTFSKRFSLHSPEVFRYVFFDLVRTFWWTLLSKKIWVGCSGITDTKSSHNDKLYLIWVPHWISRLDLSSRTSS